jgi:hypothetical protein
LAGSKFIEPAKHHEEIINNANRRDEEKMKKIYRTFTIAASIFAIISSMGFNTALGADTVTTVLKAPKDLVGVPALPFTGLKSALFTTPTSASGVVGITPQTALVGEELVISGSGLPANTPAQLVWGTTENASWAVEVTPATVNYLGVNFTTTPLFVDIATITTDALGAFSYKTKTPSDFGGTHDIYAVVGGVAVGKGGMQIGRTFTMTPSSGPVGTKFTVTYTGLGPKLYGSGGALIYDNKYVGQLQGRWTRGTAKASVIATGAVGKHYVTANAAISFSYLNILQSPDPFGTPGTAIFTVTKDNGGFKPTITYPTNLTPTVEQKAGIGISSSAFDANSKAIATLSTDHGVVESKTLLKVTGLTTTGTHNLVWSTVVGNRFNCATGTCWVYSPIPLGTVDVINGNFEKEITIPNHLGGWHSIQVMSGDKIEAQISFYVKQSIVEFKDSKGKILSYGTATWDSSPQAFSKGGSGVGKTTFKEGEEFTISVRGVGWTQMDNTLAVSYDNAHIGYGCGFNSNGYVVFRLRATGGPGTHIINLRPLLYTQQPSFANAQFGMVPFLTWDSDFPGLALGYQIPMYTFAITVTK